MLKYVYAVSVLAGTIIGVGLFALPYVALRAGTLVIVGYFVLLGAIAFFVHLLFGEVALHTPDFKRLPGFAKIYLGNWGKGVSLFAAIVGLSGTVLAYIIIGGEFLEELFSPIIGGGNLLYSFIYFAAGAIIILAGIKATSFVMFSGLILFFLILIGIFVRGFPFLEIGNVYSPIGSGADLFLLPWCRRRN